MDLIYGNSVFYTKKVLKEKNVLDYLLKVHKFTTFKFTCGMKSFMKPRRCLCLSWELKKKKPIPLSTESFSHEALSMMNWNVYFLFSFGFGKKLFWNFIVLLHCPMMLNSKQKIKSSNLVFLLEPWNMWYPKIPNWKSTIT